MNGRKTALGRNFRQGNIGLLNQTECLPAAAGLKIFRDRDPELVFENPLNGYSVTMKQIRDMFHVQFRVGERSIDQGPGFRDYGIRFVAALGPGYDPGKDIKGITENIRHFLRFSCIDGNTVKSLFYNQKTSFLTKKVTILIADDWNPVSSGVVRMENGMENDPHVFFLEKLPRNL